MNMQQNNEMNPFQMMGGVHFPMQGNPQQVITPDSFQQRYAPMYAGSENMQFASGRHQVMPEDVKRPTGGVVAYSMKMNPYLSPSGNFRKPRQDEIIKEIQIFKDMTPTGRSIRVSDANQQIRHCCITKPYFHILDAEKYRVILPNNEIEVIYYVHRECDTLIVVSDSLSE